MLVPVAAAVVGSRALVTCSPLMCSGACLRSVVRALPTGREAGRAAARAGVAGAPPDGRARRWRRSWWPRPPARAHRGGRRNGLPSIWFAPAPVRPEAAGSRGRAAGAYDVIDARRPRAPPAMLAQRLGELASSSRRSRRPIASSPRASAARAVLREIARAARTSMPVLLTGETGTGKEVAARLLHDWSAPRPAASSRSTAPRSPTSSSRRSCSATSRGAFSGAVRAYDGQLMAAEGGTVFLDEIDDTPLPLQVKLLRVLEDRVVSRLGETACAAGRLPHRRRHQPRSRPADAPRRASAPISTSGWRSSRIRCRRCASGVEDLPALVAPLRAPLLRRGAGGAARHQVARRRRRRAGGAARAIPGRATSASCATCIFEALVHKRGGDELLLSDLPRRVLRRRARRGGRRRRRGRCDGGGGGARDRGPALRSAARPSASWSAPRSRRRWRRRGGSAAAAARLLGARRTRRRARSGRDRARDDAAAGCRRRRARAGVARGAPSARPERR